MKDKEEFLDLVGGLAAGGLMLIFLYYWIPIGFILLILVLKAGNSSLLK